MLPLKAIPVTLPSFDLGPFREILSPETVNQIDSRRNAQPLSKFAEAVEESLSDHIDPYAHIYQTFYFEIPGQPYVEMTNLRLLSTTAVTEGLLVKGYASASLASWVEFVVQASKEDASQFLRLFANLVFNVMRNFPPFQNLKFQSFRDKTFGLVKA